MDVSVDNEVIVNTNGTVEVAVGNAADVIVADDHALDITVTKKEYKIVGDEVYIAKLYDDAPQWMKDLVQLVVDNTMETESAMLRNDLIRQLNQFATSYVPLNSYTQSILDLSNADTAMHDTLETLNSNFNDGLDTANSQIIDLQSTKASKTEVATKVIETLTAQLATPTSELGAIIGNLQQTIVDGDSANADSVTTLMSVLEGEVDARASAIETINTYVGLVDGIPNGTGLLASIDDLQNQIDGNIATWFYDGIPTLLTAPAVLWTTSTEKASHIGDIYYDKTSGYGYRFSYEDIIDTPNMGVIYSWIRIVDTDVVKALADAANAQSTADGKVVTFYQATAPTAEGVGDLWIDSDAGNKMYRWNGSNWGTDLVGTMVANASAVTSLSTELSNGTTTWAAADSTVVNSLNTTISNGDAAVEAKWAYNSALVINGTAYNSGFGLSNSAGTGIGSEFWIDASRLKFTNSAKTGRTAPFTIDASGATPQITFNGRVSFSNVTGTPTHTSGLLANRPAAPVAGSTYTATDQDNQIYTYTNVGWIAGGDPDALTAADLGASGTTVIDGARITTGTLNASLVNVININASNISTGVIYNSGGNASNYTMKIDLNAGEIHIR